MGGWMTAFENFRAADSRKLKWRERRAPDGARSVLECASPLALWPNSSGAALFSPALTERDLQVASIGGWMTAFENFQTADTRKLKRHERRAPGATCSVL
jgi:hypothetical protein